jgi:hypothetical protein
MLSPKRFNLLLAAILASSSLVFVIATYNIADVNAESKVSGLTLTSKILRRKERLDAKPNVAELAALRKAARVQEERVFEDKIPKHLPIKVKIRADKEKAAKDLDNPRWHRDLEIEVKNTGDKPIYYMFLIFEMPEIRLAGNAVTYTLTYGENSIFDDSKGIAKTDDISLKPKETFILKLDDQQARAWEGWQKREQWPQPKNVVIICEELNFGDGTGFFGGNGSPWPLPRKKQAFVNVFNRSRTDSREIKTHHTTSVKARSVLNTLIGGESASQWPTRFRWGECLNSSISAIEDKELLPDEYCCPNDCQFVDIYYAKFCYYCPILQHADGVSCFWEFDGICATVIPDQKLCSDDVYCPFQRTYPCGYIPPSPTPTPDTPTPTPTAPPCDPATKPNNTNCICDTTPYIIAGAPPQWSCFCSAGTAANRLAYGSNQGCEPNKHNNGSECCVCIVQECPDGSTPNKTTCECPTPTPEDPGPFYQARCVDYYYVWFVSYDGGYSWTPTGRVEYSGCYLIFIEV